LFHEDHSQGCDLQDHKFFLPSLEGNWSGGYAEPDRMMSVLLPRRYRSTGKLTS
jgi:hypothetical protein